MPVVDDAGPFAPSGDLTTVSALDAVAVEPPLNIQRKFPANSSKNDLQDSQNIAEYACRYSDKLSLWKPRDEILEQIKLLLTTRQQRHHFEVAVCGDRLAITLRGADREGVQPGLGHTDRAY